MKRSELVLASTSPRRKELLSGCNLEFIIQAPDCDESVLPRESPEAMVRRLALAKALSVASNFQQSWVIGADTTVAINGEILGKPLDKIDAFRMLSKLQGTQHQVWGGLALVNQSRNIQWVESHCSSVQLVNLSVDEIEQYIETGEPFDKAGSYAIQGIGAGFVSEIIGSYTNVVGLNLSALLQALKSQGYKSVTD